MLAQRAAPKARPIRRVVVRALRIEWIHTNFDRASSDVRILFGQGIKRHPSRNLQGPTRYHSFNFWSLITNVAPIPAAIRKGRNGSNPAMKRTSNTQARTRESLRSLYHRVRMQRESAIKRARRPLPDDMAARMVRIEERLSKFLEKQQASPYVRRRIE